MKKILYIILLFACVQTSTYAQKEKYIWHFGHYAGLDFNNPQTLILRDDLTSTDVTMTNMPTSIISPMVTGEGCFTLSNAKGELIMSSDGQYVYKKDYMDYMPSTPQQTASMMMEGGTGLNGGGSATQSGMVVPNPANKNKYYIFTVPQDRANLGLCYTEVDMSLNQGLGKVITKNTVLLAGGTLENIAMTAKPDESGYWLVHRGIGKLYVWSITAAGISLHQEYAMTSPATAFAGSTFFSPNNDYIVCTLANSGNVYIGSFDVNTGTVSAGRVRSLGYFPYSGAFSNSQEYLYISCAVAGGDLRGVTYRMKTTDMLAGTGAWEIVGGVIAAGYNIVNVEKSPYENDDRLFGIQSGERTIYVIEDLDNPAGATVRKFLDYLQPNTKSTIGLPTFGSSFFSAKAISNSFTCAAYDGTYTVEVDIAGTTVPQTIEWNFGDNSVLQSQVVTVSQSVYKMKYAYASPGAYVVTATPIKADGTRLEAVKMDANIIACNLRTNPSIRVDLQNANVLDLKNR